MERLPSKPFDLDERKRALLQIGFSPEAVERTVQEAAYETELWNNAGDAGAWAGRKIRDLKAQNAELKIALEKIACRHVLDEPLWWQVEARNALDNS